jgi:hypothetical protein
VRSLPSHGRIHCARCFPDGANWGITTLEQDGWLLENNPLAWGASNPRYLVLGFSKGTRQCQKLLTAPHNEIPYAGFRHNLTAILRKLGLLGSDRHAEDRIRESELDFAFGSLIRCSVGHVDQTTGLTSKSGDIINRLSQRTEKNDWALNCMKEFLGKLPSRLEVVVLLSNDSAYVEACFGRLQSLYPEMKRINSVAYTDGRITWIHTVHGSPLAQSHINAWLEGGNTVQGEKQRAAVAAIKQVESLGPVVTSVDSADEVAELPAYHAEETPHPVQSVGPTKNRDASDERQTPSSNRIDGPAVVAPRFERIAADGELFVAHRFNDGRYRMANPALGRTKHHAENQLSVDINQIAGYLKMGHLLRMRGERSKQVNLITALEIKIISD